jgi:hypothetical protein
MAETYKESLVDGRALVESRSSKETPVVCMQIVQAARRNAARMIGKHRGSTVWDRSAGVRVGLRFAGLQSVLVTVGHSDC